MLSMCGLNYANSNNGKPISVYGTILGFNAFNFLTDGVVVALMLIKLYYGLRYVSYVSFPEKRAYEYLEEAGEERWRIKRTKKLRLLFKDFFIASITAYTFIFLQTVVLVLVFLSHSLIWIRYGSLFIVSIFQIFFMFRLNQHLKELDI